MNYRVSVLLLAWFSHYFHFCLRSFLYRSTYCYFVFFRYVFDGIRWKLIIFGKVTITLNYIISSKPYSQSWCPIHTKVVGNKAKGRISKRVFQENKTPQIFRKTNFSYSLIRDKVHSGPNQTFFFQISVTASNNSGIQDMNHKKLSCLWDIHLLRPISYDCSLFIHSGKIRKLEFFNVSRGYSIVDKSLCYHAGNSGLIPRGGHTIKSPISPRCWANSAFHHSEVGKLVTGNTGPNINSTTMRVAPIDHHWWYNLPLST